MGLFPVQRIGPPGDRYLIRYHLTPWKRWPFKHRAYLHVFYRGDADDIHDHPFDFGSLVLWGAYTERMWSPGETYRDACGRACPYLVTHKRRWMSWRYVKAEHAHKIVALHGRPVITLVLRGPKRRDWSFWTPAYGRWPQAVPWRTYLGIDEQPVEMADAA